ncbi:hypothetical protein [Streptomyces nigrescens]
MFVFPNSEEELRVRTADLRETQDEETAGESLAGQEVSDVTRSESAPVSYRFSRQACLQADLLQDHSYVMLCLMHSDSGRVARSGLGAASCGAQTLV